MHVITTEERDEMRETFRDHVLKAMDICMNQTAAYKGWAQRDNCSGARDADLPELFKALDTQHDKNLAHLGVIVRDDDAEDYEKAEQRLRSQ